MYNTIPEYAGIQAYNVQIDQKLDSSLFMNTSMNVEYYNSDVPWTGRIAYFCSMVHCIGWGTRKGSSPGEVLDGTSGIIYVLLSDMAFCLPLLKSAKQTPHVKIEGTMRGT